MGKFRVKCELDYEATEPVVFLLNLRAQDTACQKILEETFCISPPLAHTPLTCGVTNNRFDRVSVDGPAKFSIVYEAVVEPQVDRVLVRDLPETTHDDFDLEHLNFLYPSRYCQSDRVGRFATLEFGAIQNPVQKVQAIVRWISEHVSYVRGSSNVNTSAVDTLVDHAGVCRDFAHLGIALCRSQNIPARYFTGYAHELEPQDFHACFETWIGGRWLLWDATKLAVPDRVVRIGTGRDAADVSVCTALGRLTLKYQHVSCEALEPMEAKLSDDDLLHIVVSHDTGPTSELNSTVSQAQAA